jgi:multidrug efflux pump subunit AcrA (membrane-fusion protein)
VLVVPVAALSSAADGQARVEVQNDDGTLTSVPVEAGLSTEGFVEVTPVGVAELNEGDLVVVGSNG